MAPSTKPAIQYHDVKIFNQDVMCFLAAIDDASVDLIITDPAYSGMNQHLQLGCGRIVGNYAQRGKQGKWFDEFHDSQENYQQLLSHCYRILKPNRHIFIMFDAFSLLSLGAALRTRFQVKNIISWDKMAIGMGHYFRRQSEFIVFACKGKRALSRRDIGDVWRIKRLHRAPYPTQKPVELFEAMIASSKRQEDQYFSVCDPFVGSGSAAIAALKQHSQFIGADISARAIDICAQRIKTFIESGKDHYQPRCAVDPTQQKVFW